MLALALVLVCPGCWLAIASEYDPLEHYGGSHSSKDGATCVERVRGAKSSHWEFDGKPIGSFDLEKVVQPDARGRAGFRMARAGGVLFGTVMVLQLGAIAIVAAAGSSTEDNQIPRWAEITTLSIEAATVTLVATSLPLLLEGNKLEREAVNAYNEWHACP